MDRTFELVNTEDDVWEPKRLLDPSGIQLKAQRSDPNREMPESKPEIINVVVKSKGESAIWPFLTGALGSAAFWLMFWAMFLGPVA